MQHQRTRITVETATEILKEFGLKEIPTTIPYANETSTCLDLPPPKLTEKEIKTIAASARIYNAAWCLADISNWLQAHPDASLSRDEVWSRLQRTGLKRQTLHNYQSVGKKFPCKDRIPELAFGYHDTVSGRDVPRAVRKKLLRQAVNDSLTLGQFRELVQIRKEELMMGRSHKPDRRRIALNAMSKKLVRCSSWARKARDIRGLTAAEAQTMEQDFERAMTLYGQYKNLSKS